MDAVAIRGRDGVASPASGPDRHTSLALLPVLALVGAAWVTLLTLDLTGRFFGPRRMDNDQINLQPLIPAQATADIKFGGQYDRFFWSAAVLNVFDRHYFDYAIASGGIAGGPFFPGGLPPTIGLYNAFPLAGRTFLVQAGATF